MNIRQRYLAIVLITAFFAGYIAPICLFVAARPFGANNPAAVFLPFDLRQNGRFKLKSLARVRPEILCISSSRAGTLQEQMFAPYRFYNMSFTAWTTEQIADAFERATRDSPPRVAIVSIDYFLFTDDWERSYAGSRTMMYGGTLEYLKASIADLLRAMINDPRLPIDFWTAPAQFVGTQAVLHREGFRSDGSYLYSPAHVAESRLHHLTPDTLVNAMPGAPNMSERQKAPLIRMAVLAKQRGIKLIGVQLPFIRAGVDYLDHNESYHHYSGVWREFESEQNRKWLESLGISFFDLGRSTIDDDNENFVDAYHTSELGAFRVVQQLLTFPEFRAVLPDIDSAATTRQIHQIEMRSRTNASSDGLSTGGAQITHQKP